MASERACGKCGLVKSPKSFPFGEQGFCDTCIREVCMRMGRNALARISPKTKRAVEPVSQSEPKRKLPEVPKCADVEAELASPYWRGIGLINGHGP